MLVIRIELWPHGDASRCRTLATGTIVNDGTGTAAQGNYRVELNDALGRLWKSGTITGFPRKRLLAWDLLARALYYVLGNRICQPRREIVTQKQTLQRCIKRRDK